MSKFKQSITIRRLSPEKYYFSASINENDDFIVCINGIDSPLKYNYKTKRFSKIKLKKQPL